MAPNSNFVVRFSEINLPSKIRVPLMIYSFIQSKFFLMSGLELPFYDFCSFLEKKSSVENTTICFFKSIFAAVVMMLKLRKLV